jgi:hypothetical protein
MCFFASSSLNKKTISWLSWEKALKHEEPWVERPIFWRRLLGGVNGRRREPRAPLSGDELPTPPVTDACPLTNHERTQVNDLDDLSFAVGFQRRTTSAG